MLAARRVLHNPVASGPPPTGLILHLDATKITGVADGAAIASWDDLSPSANNFTPPAGYAPIYHDTSPSGLINGKPAVQFTSTDFQRLSNTKPVTIQPQGQAGKLTVAVVLKLADDAAPYMAFSMTGSSIGVFLGNQEFVGSTYRWGFTAYASGDLGLKTAAAADANPHTVIATSDYASTYYGQLLIDGSQPALDPSSSDLAGIENGPYQAGYVNLGWFSVGSNYDWFNGLIGEVLLYTPNLDAAGEASLYSYLKTKWGTP